jgi:hypothetical protein
VDLVEIRPGKKPILYEVKHSTSPTLSKGMHSAIRDLDPQNVYVVHPGKESYPMGKGIEAYSLINPPSS